MFKTRFISILALLCLTVTSAWAQEVTLLTTILSTGDNAGFVSGSKTFDNIATVTFSGTVSNDDDEWGWYYEQERTLTVTAAEGYTITRVKFYTDEGSAFDEEAPFEAILVYDQGNIAKVNGTSIGSWGVTKIEVYGYAGTPAPAEPATYTVTVKDGTEDATSWTIAPAEATTTGVAAGTTVTATYSGTKKVKSVKAVKKAVVTTFSELQTALSAGKNVKLMNDIVCTAEISITSKGALTIDGNGKKLSTTSAIRAFNVGSSATVAFKNLTLTGFVNGGGPAILNTGTIVLDGCTISNCHVNNSNGGGAIENKNNGKLYAINTTFSGNYSGEIGGAINNYNSSLYMSGCTFTDNYTTKSSAYWGGAIGINGGSEVRLINCTFSGNKYGTTTGTSDIGVYKKPTNYTIAGCTGAAIASNEDITTIASGTATLDYSDLSNISFTYNAE